MPTLKLVGEGTSSMSTITRRKAVDMKRYRGKMKKDKPDEWKEHLDREKKRQKKYRKEMTPDQKAIANLKAKERVRKYRERKKEIQKKTPIPSPESAEKRMTRNEKVKLKIQRSEWAKKKREQRKKQSVQKKRREKQKDAARKREKYVQISKQVELPTNVNDDEAYQSPEARRKAVYRVKRTMPQNPAKFADVIHTIIKRSTPRKRGELLARNIYQRKEEVSSVIKVTCSQLERKYRRLFLAQLTKNIRSKERMSTISTLGFSWQALKRARTSATRKRRSDVTSTDVETSVRDFFLRPDVSTEMPNVKGIKKDGKAKHVMQLPLEKAFTTWKEENPGLPLSSSKFSSLRCRRQILVQSKAKLYQCLCENCANVDLKLKALNYIIDHKMTTNIKPQKLNKYSLNDITMCPKVGKYQKLECIDRSCSECGTAQTYFESFQCIKEEIVTWKMWGPVSQDGHKKTGIIKKSGNVGDLLAAIQHDAKPFSNHLFEASWQQNMFWGLTKSVSHNTLLMVMDFAENYTCMVQNAVQGHHWNKNQVTIHPFVVYYRCEECPDQVVREAVDIISDDRKHDAHAVTAFTQATIDHLKNRVQFSKVIQFSDGCASQYKSKMPFTDISLSNGDYGVSIERHYFGSRHGKNPCDGEGGTLKSAVAGAVRAKDLVIDTAVDFHGYCQENLSKGSKDDAGNCRHARRSVLLVNEIDRERPDRENTVTLKGTRKLHAVKPVEPYKLSVRRLSCFCDACSDGTDSCSNSQYVSNWQDKDLLLRRTCQMNISALDKQDDAIIDEFDVTIPDTDEQSEHVETYDSQQVESDAGQNSITQSILNGLSRTPNEIISFDEIDDFPNLDSFIDGVVTSLPKISEEPLKDQSEIPPKDKSLFCTLIYQRFISNILSVSLYGAKKGTDGQAGKILLGKMKVASWEKLHYKWMNHAAPIDNNSLLCYDLFLKSSGFNSFGFNKIIYTLQEMQDAYSV